MIKPLFWPLARYFGTVIGLGFVFGLSAAEGQTSSPLPVNSFFGLPAVGMPRLSPDGSKIAFLFPHEGRMALGVFDRASK